MSQIKGTTSSVSSTPPSMTEQLAKQNPNYIPKTAQGGAIVDEFLTGHDEVNVPDVPKTATTERVTKIERLDDNTFRETTVRSHLDESRCGYIHVSSLSPFVSWLLGEVLSVIDSSVPNKDQNRAIKHLIRKSFDRTMQNVHEEVWPPNTVPPLQRNEYLVNPYQ